MSDLLVALVVVAFCITGAVLYRSRKKRLEQEKINKKWEDDPIRYH